MINILDLNHCLKISSLLFLPKQTYLQKIYLILSVSWFVPDTIMSMIFGWQKFDTWQFPEILTGAKSMELRHFWHTITRRWACKLQTTTIIHVEMGLNIPGLYMNVLNFDDAAENCSFCLRTPLVPQTHPTTVPYDFGTRTISWRTRWHFTPVLFSWSYQATGSARLENNRQYSISINHALVAVFNYILHISRITYITQHNATLWLIVDWTPPKNGAWLLQCPRGSNNNVK